MIQRIQTVYLAAAFLLQLMMLFMPLGTTGSYVFKTHQISSPDGILRNTWEIFALIIISAVSILSAIFLYKNRPLQIKTGRLNILLQTVLIVLIFFNFDKAVEITGLEGEYHIATFFPLICLILIFLANSAIKKDDDMVKAADRLR